MFFVDCYGPSALIMASLSNNARVDESDEITLDSDPGDDINKGHGLSSSVSALETPRKKKAKRYCATMHRCLIMPRMH
jgi:hypothetical protein